ncbi:MAG: hypothetical protein JNM41_10075 [Flavipsychrobacter sp.]|nr:hypothetical protein [Flavipsychrobacter sp.]
MNSYYRVVGILFAALGFLMLRHTNPNSHTDEKSVHMLGAVLVLLSSLGLFVVNVLKRGRHNEDIL